MVILSLKYGIAEKQEITFYASLFSFFLILIQYLVTFSSCDFCTRIIKMVLFNNVGILLCYVAGKYLNWRWLALLGAGIPVPFLICMFLIPETPQWYINRSKYMVSWMNEPIPLMSCSRISLVNFDCIFYLFVIQTSKRKRGKLYNGYVDQMRMLVKSLVKLKKLTNLIKVKNHLHLPPYSTACMSDPFWFR